MSSESDLPEVLFRTRLRRPERNTPWGFRLQGGVEFSKPLTLLKVIPDSIAAKVGLNAGDILVRLAGQSAVSMTHRDAQQAIVNSGNTLEIIVERADVTCPSFSAKVQPEVNALSSETGPVEKQNDLQNNSGMKIEDTIDENYTSLINNTELIVVDNVPGNDVSDTKPEPEVPQNRNTSTTTTASSTPPSVIPTPPTTTDHPHPHHHTPLVVNDGVTMTPSRTAPPEMENPPPGDDQEEGDLPGGKTVRTEDEDLRMEEKLEQEEEEEEEEEEKLVASAAGLVLPDHNDNIPLVEIELPDSFPVQALIKTNALTSEHGDDSTEGADDLSSEFSDDVSVIEVQPEVSEAATGSVDDGEDDDVIVDTDSLFYQSESEYREISLLNFDHRLLEPTTTRLLEPTTRLLEPTTRLLEPTTARLPVAESSSVPETDMSRMRACFYLPSIVADIEPKAGKTGGGSSSIEKLETRDFSQTAPWRLAKVIGGSRRPDDAAASGQQASTSAAAAERKSEHPVSENNVIYIPISIFDQQLKLGSDYTFQRISQATSGDLDLQRSPPMSLTLMGRRIEERLVVANAENKNNNLGVLQQRSSPDDVVALPTTAVTMTTARVYIAPMTSQSIPVAKGEAEVVPSSAAAAAVVESRRVSSDVLSELQDIPLPAVKDIVADLNSRLVKVAESYETSGSGGGQSAELGTSFTRPEVRRRRSSSGSDSDRDTVAVEDPTPSKGLDRDHRQCHLDVPDQASTVYHSVVYRTRLSPKPSIRRFSLPGGSVTVRDSASSSSSSSQRRVRFAEPPESSVIEIEARRARVRDTNTAAAAAAAQSASVSSLAKKLDRIELENALASAAMKRSRPFQVQVQAQDQVVSSLLASHPAQHPDAKTPPAPLPTAPKRGPNHRGAAPVTWKLDPIQERVIKIQTVQPSDLIRGDESRQFRIASQQQQQQRGVAPLDSVQCSADFGGIFSLSIGPGSGGHLNLSLQQHPAGNHGAARSVYSPTKVNLVLPSSAAAAGGVGGEPGKFSYSVSTGGGSGRAPIKYTLPPSYEESMLAMASGRHPRSSSLDEAKPGASPGTVLPSRVSELRSESHHHLVPGGFSTHHHQHQQPGLRIVRARSPTLSGASHHPGWVISTSQDPGPHRDPRSYCQTLQVDTGSKQTGRAQSYGLPVYHARSGALSTDVAGSQQQQPVKDGSHPVDPIFRIVAPQPSAARGGKQGAAGADLSRPDMAARLVRGGSPLILASTGLSVSGPAKPPVQGAAGVRSFSPVSSPPGADKRWPPTGRLQDPRGPHQGPSVYSAEAPLRSERRWPSAAAVAGLGPPIAQHPPPQPASFPGEAHRQRPLPSPTATAHPFPEARGGAGLPPALQRMPGIFALLDKTFTDKVKQWEGSSRSGGLQQSETYKLVREMDDAMKQDKL